MPAVAAHFQFGQLVFEKLHEEVRGAVQANKDMFDFALQGPDLLFYHSIFSKTDIVALGVDIHRKSGDEFFLPMLGRDLSPTAFAYVLGCLCHYALDVACHPYVNEVSQNIDKEHRSLESDLDLAIIEKYNITKKRHLFLPKKGKLDKEAIAKVYGIEPKQVLRCIKTQRATNYWLGHTGFIRFADKISRQKGLFLSLSLKKSVQYKQETEKLVELLEEAVSSTAQLLFDYFHSAKTKQAFETSLTKNFEGAK